MEGETMHLCSLVRHRVLAGWMAGCLLLIDDIGIDIDIGIVIGCIGGVDILTVGKKGANEPTSAN